MSRNPPESQEASATLARLRGAAPWRNGGASDSKSEGCGFNPHRGQFWPTARSRTTYAAKPSWPHGFSPPLPPCYGGLAGQKITPITSPSAYLRRIPVSWIPSSTLNTTPSTASRTSVLHCTVIHGSRIAYPHGIDSLLRYYRRTYYATPDTYPCATCVHTAHMWHVRRGRSRGAAPASLAGTTLIGSLIASGSCRLWTDGS